MRIKKGSEEEARQFAAEELRVSPEQVGVNVSEDQSGIPQGYVRVRCDIKSGS
jgi:hypothetical protein